MDLRSPKLFFESSHVSPLLSNFERLFLDSGIDGLLGELLSLTGLGPVLISLACRHRTPGRLHCLAQRNRRWIGFPTVQSGAA